MGNLPLHGILDNYFHFSRDVKLTILDPSKLWVSWSQSNAQKSGILIMYYLCAETRSVSVEEVICQKVVIELRKWVERLVSGKTDQDTVTDVSQRDLDSVKDVSQTEKIQGF